MKWLVGTVIVGFLYYYFVMVKAGNLNFWKVVNANPEKAYSFFKNSSSFIVFDSEPTGGYRAHLPPGDWDGPFNLALPSGNRVIVDGRTPDYEAAQEGFIRSTHG